MKTETADEILVQMDKILSGRLPDIPEDESDIDRIRLACGLLCDGGALAAAGFPGWHEDFTPEKEQAYEEGKAAVEAAVEVAYAWLKAKEFTQGPWRAEEAIVENSSNKAIVKQAKWGGEIVADCGLYCAKSAASATLMAKAPEMLALLRRMEDFVSDIEPDDGLGSAVSRRLLFDARNLIKEIAG